MTARIALLAPEWLVRFIHVPGSLCKAEVRWPWYFILARMESVRCWINWAEVHERRVDVGDVYQNLYCCSGLFWLVVAAGGTEICWIIQAFVNRLKDQDGDVYKTMQPCIVKQIYEISDNIRAIGNRICAKTGKESTSMRSSHEILLLPAQISGELTEVSYTKSEIIRHKEGVSRDRSWYLISWRSDIFNIWSEGAVRCSTSI